MYQGKTTLHFKRKNFYTDVEDVTAYICRHCGTRSIPADVAKRISDTVEHLSRSGAMPTGRPPAFTGISFHKVA